MTEELQPFYDYGSSLAGPFDPDRLPPEDVFPTSSPEQAARQLAQYMADWAGDRQWLEPKRLAAMAVLIEEARHVYFHGLSEGDPAVLAGLHTGPWRHLDGYRDWLWKVAEQGTRDRPHDDGREVADPDVPDELASNDYSAYDRGGSLEADWPATREHLFAKPRVSDEAAGQQAGRRKRGVGKDPDKPRRSKDQRTQPQYGVLRHYLGDFRPRRVGTVPFYAIWPIAQSFWREHAGSEFRTNFAQAHDKAHGRRGREHPITGRLLGPDATWCTFINCDPEQPPSLNPASHFWAALCGKLDLLLDLDAMTPDPELWAYILSFTGEAAGEARIDAASLTEPELVELERQRLLLIAERTERAAREALRARN